MVIIFLIFFQVIIYEITRLKSRHKRLREVLLPAQAQSLDVFSEGRLCVGYQSGFTIYSLLGDQHPLSLVHPDNQVCCKHFIIESTNKNNMCLHGFNIIVLNIMKNWLDSEIRPIIETFATL